MVKVKINDRIFDGNVVGSIRDNSWGNRSSKSITLKIDYETTLATFTDDVPWSILYQPSDYYDPETQQMVTPPVEEYDNSEYCVAGSITNNRNGTVTVKMGKPTFEELYNILKEAAESEPTAEVQEAR